MKEFRHWVRLNLIGGEKQRKERRGDRSGGGVGGEE